MSPLFDAAAVDYDKQFSHTFTGLGQRNAVWKHLNLIFENHPKKTLNVLEINCGTGEDAIYLAQLGHQVLATDISPKMIEVAQSKLEDNLSVNLSFNVLDINSLELINDKFDVVFSNFGGLNCLSPNQLIVLSEKVKQILLPNGVFIAVIMSRKCAWEQLYFLAKRNKIQQKRRLKKNAIEINVDGQTVPTWFYNPKECIDLMRNQLSFQMVKPIGIGFPPSYLSSLFEKKPVLKGIAHTAEFFFSNSSALANRADHFLITFTT